MKMFGIDIGGSGIKGAPVDVDAGDLASDRHRIKTPQPATPDAVMDVAAKVVRKFKWKGAVGCALPSVVQHGIVYSAANIDPSLIDTDGEALLSARLGEPVHL